MKRLFLLNTTLALVLLVTIIAHATALEVGAGEPYSTIQSAINAPVTGDTEFVYGGASGETIKNNNSDDSLDLFGITYGVDAFVAVGRDSSNEFPGVVFTSPDGMTWKKETSAYVRMPLESVTYGNNVYVAVGGNGEILTSDDSNSWKNSRSNSICDLKDVAYGNNLFITVGSGSITIPIPPNLFFHSWDIILNSQDGITWHKRNLTSISYPYYYDFQGITYGKDIFVAVGWYGAICTSPDGMNWTEQKFHPDEQYEFFRDVSFGENIYVVVGEWGVILTSPDGITWTVRVSDSTTQSDLNSVTYGNGLFVAVGNNGSIITSSGGKKWETSYSGTIKNLYGVTFGNNTFIAVGEGGIVLISPDGITWAKRDL